MNDENDQTPETDEPNAAYYARQHALSCAHNPAEPPEDVVRRAKAYADFILNA